MIGAFAIITQGLITNLCDAFFMSWLLAVPSLSVLAGSQSAKREEGVGGGVKKKKKQKGWSQTNSLTLTYTPVVAGRDG